MTLDQVSNFIGMARLRLNKGGEIALFDILDPLIYPMFAVGAFREKGMRAKMVARYIKNKTFAIGRAICGMPSSDMGYVHHSQDIEKIALKNGLKTEKVNSIYHEYRYHVLLKIMD